MSGGLIAHWISIFEAKGNGTCAFTPLTFLKHFLGAKVTGWKVPETPVRKAGPVPASPRPTDWQEVAGSFRPCLCLEPG